MLNMLCRYRERREALKRRDQELKGAAIATASRVLDSLGKALEQLDQRHRELSGGDPPPDTRSKTVLILVATAIWIADQFSTEFITHAEQAVFTRWLFEVFRSASVDSWINQGAESTRIELVNFWNTNINELVKNLDARRAVVFPSLDSMEAGASGDSVWESVSSLLAALATPGVSIEESSQRLSDNDEAGGATRMLAMGIAGCFMHDAEHAMADSLEAIGRHPRQNDNLIRGRLLQPQAVGFERALELLKSLKGESSSGREK